MAENTMRQPESGAPRFPELPIDKVGIPSRGKVIGPTPQEVKDANAGKLVPKGVTKLLNKWKAGVVGAAAVGGAVAAYETIPAVHQAVDEQFLERIGVSTKEIGPTFDNNEVKHLIGENNISRISQQQVPNLTPEYDARTETLNYLFPFKLREGVTASFDKSIRVRSGIDPKRLGINETPLIKFSDKGVGVIAPADSQMALFRGEPEYGQGGEDPNYAVHLVLFHYDPTEDVTILWSFTSMVGDRTGTFLPSFPMQSYFGDIVANGRTDWQEKLPTVKAGTTVMETTDANQTVDFRVGVYKGRVIDTSSEVAPFTHFFTNPSNQLTVVN